MIAMLVSLVAELIVLLAVAVVLSSYERRSMSLLHNRDAPIAYMLVGLGQPVADGGKLLMKSTIHSLLLGIHALAMHGMHGATLWCTHTYGVRSQLCTYVLEIPMAVDIT